MAIDPTGIATSLAQQAGPLEPGSVSNNVEAARDFESYLVETMIREMRKTLPEGLFQSTGVEMFSGMFDQAVAKEISAAGGLGLADSMLQGMEGASINSLVMPVEPGATGGTHWPTAPFAGESMPVDGLVTSEFGYRNDPFHGGRRFHKGIDIAAPTGTAIRSLAEGVVSIAEQRPGLGRVVMVEHEDGWRSLYAHCEGVDVEPGQRVQAGETIATVGSSGRSTGPHLHLELHHDGRAVDPAESLGW